MAKNEKPTTRAQQFRAEFTIPYAPGTLKAIGLIAGKPAAEYELRTAGNPAAIRLTPDRSTLRADAQDLSYITVEITDHNGQLQPNADHSIQFTIDGPATIAGIGSADLKSLEPYQTHERRTFQGRALVVLRTTHQPGPIRLTAQSPNLTPAHIIVNSQ